MNSTARTWRRVVTVLCVGVALACADQSRLLAPPLRMNGEPPGQQEPFFKAWDWGGIWRTSPTQSQINGLDVRQYRQVVSFVVDTGTVYPFARANPGKLYINGDEPDQAHDPCTPPSAYAVTYHNFVADIRSADPTAHLSPAGFAEDNSACPGGPHATAYAQQFYDAYLQLYGSAPPVDEWRFHDLGLGTCCNNGGDTTAWKDSVTRKAAWSVAHGANMVLGSWGVADWDSGSGWNAPLSVFLADLRQMMLFLQRDGRINQAVWCSYSPSSGCGVRYLADASGVETQVGYMYQCPPPVQIPSGVNAVGPGSYGAKLQWTNTSTGCEIAAEFWVEPAGSYTWSLNRLLYFSPGRTDSGYWGFNQGDRVKGRVQYYDGTTPGVWSAFSNVVLVQ
jgi:hypothetical protein